METEKEIREGATYRFYVKNGFTDKEAIEKIKETKREMEELQFITPE